MKLAKAKLKPFIGQWLIDEMETWDQEYVNMETRGHFTFKKEAPDIFSSV